MTTNKCTPDNLGSMACLDSSPDNALDSPLENYALLFKALSDPVRLSMIAKLSSLSNPASVSELSSCCGIDFSGVSRHLKILKEANVLNAERSGRHVLYSLNSEMLSERLSTLAAALD